MTIHKVDPNNLPDCEVLAYNSFNVEDSMLVGELFKINRKVYCESTTRNHILGGVTHYIHASDLVNHFKTATNAQD